MKIEMNEEIVVGKSENRMQVEYAQIEPDGEHVQETEDELTKRHLASESNRRYLS